MVLCHGDPTRANLVNTNGSWVWVDLEYTGMAPASLDVGMCVVSLIRFCGREAAREMVAGYQQAGGTFDPADAILLGGLRDLCGAADFAAATTANGRQTFALRFGSFSELFRQTRW
jgi:Ser/Thr protein kinase RdoA (MazF antagonist)